MLAVKALNARIINLLIAFLISLLVIFPDIIFLKECSLQTDRREMFQEDIMQPPPQQRWDGEYVPGEFVSRPSQQDTRLPRTMPSISTKRIGLNFVFFFGLSLTLLFILPFNLLYDKLNLNKRLRLGISIIECLVICILFAVLHTLIDFRKDVFLLDGMNIFKIFFVGLVSFLFVYVMYLINQQQKIIVENERLKSENLQAQYNMLTTQINPHFFFNSLNALSSLVRENENSKSLKYINELSEIFRYVLKSNKQELALLKDELDFLRAYLYMLEIRYDGKLYFDIRIDGKYHEYLIPTLSLQLLIENIIKHNEISDEKPLTAMIYTSDDNMLMVSNPIHKKLQRSHDSGVGLINLNNRYQLLISKSIIVEYNKETFTVKLPLSKNIQN